MPPNQTPQKLRTSDMEPHWIPVDIISKHLLIVRPLIAPFLVILVDFYVAGYELRSAPRLGTISSGPRHLY